LIEGRLGVRVLLTRDDDRNVPIDERTSIANNNKADLFVSLHVNSSLRKSASGASIYYAAFGPDVLKGQGSTSQAGRLTTFGGGSRTIELVPWDLAQTRHVDQSMVFSQMLEQQLHDHIPLATRPVGAAPLLVLESANMPAVLVEMGFLSNPDQEKQISGQEFQTAFAQALVDAIVRFRDSLPNGGVR
jgi:N-acetylmuramoyl-L-alanine amidase